MCAIDIPSTPMKKIVLLSNSFNSMTQRIHLECNALGFKSIVHIYQSEQSVLDFIEQERPDLILCPFLTKRVPEKIYSNDSVPCLIFHPGITGDRGMSAIDWALLKKREEWGLTIMQAAEEMDSGDIWATQNFFTSRLNGNPPTKSSLYRIECIEAAVKGLHNTLERFLAKNPPVPLDYTDPSVKGTLMPMMKKADRKVDWSLGMNEIVRIVSASDSQPGVLDIFGEMKYFMFGAHKEEHHQYPPSTPEKTILAQRNGAILISCGHGESVWITHLKKLNTKTQKYFKLPATMVLPNEMLDNVPALSEPDLFLAFQKFPSTFQEIFSWSSNGVCYIWFDFYNGAMSTAQCQRLCKAWDRIMETDKSGLIVLMGGINFFSNGIHLNTIEASSNPAAESWENINAIDDFVKRILTCKDRYIVSAMQGNSGAGGVMAAIAADQVWAHGNIVLNASYKGMNLYGSEYWTYSLPRRVGDTIANELTGSTEPIRAYEAVKVGLIDKVLCDTAGPFLKKVLEESSKLAARADFLDSIAKKVSFYTVESESLMQKCRDKELNAMKVCFQDPTYHNKRKAFVYKSAACACVKKVEGADSQASVKYIVG